MRATDTQPTVVQDSAIHPQGKGIDPLLNWRDSFSLQDGSHSVLMYNGVVVAEGWGNKQVEARGAAIAAHVRNYMPPSVVSEGTT